jgi:RNA polymerase sigma-B factor
MSVVWSGDRAAGEERRQPDRLPRGLLAVTSDERLAAAAQAGDGEARETLILRHQRLVRAIVRTYRSAGFSEQDLRQAGAIGLITAIDRFQADRGVRFATYAGALVRGEVRHTLRDQGWAVQVPRPLQDLGRRAALERERLTQATGRTPSLEETAAALDADPGDVASALVARRSYRAAEYAETGDHGAGEAAHAAATGDDGYELSELRIDLVSALRRLPVQQRRAIILRFTRGLPQRVIAAELGVSQMQVSRLLREALTTLRSLLEPSRSRAG